MRLLEERFQENEEAWPTAKKGHCRYRGKKDADIDFFDIREVIDWSGAEMGKFYRPPKKSVTMRLDQDVIDRLKAYGRGYQTKVNFLLRTHGWRSARGVNRKRSPMTHSST